jgi:hypothetical protein
MNGVLLPIDVMFNIKGDRDTVNIITLRKLLNTKQALLPEFFWP